MEPEQGKGHGTQEGGQHAQNGELHDAAGTQPCGEHDESAAAGEIIQQKRGGVLPDEAGRKKNDALDKELGDAENTDDGSCVGG